MNIVYVTLGYKPAYRLGGPIRSVSALAERMASRGHKVTVFATNSDFDRDLDVVVDKPVMVDGVEVWYFRRTNWIGDNLAWLPYLSNSVGYLYTPALRGAMERILPSIDVVHTQMPFIYPTWLAGGLALKNGKPLFYSARGSLHPELLKYRGLKKRIYIELFEKKLLNGASGLIALTEDERNDYAVLGLKPPSHVVPNGIDVGDFQGEPSQNVLKLLGIDENSQVIVFLGRLHTKKGGDIAIEAFLSIAHRYPHAILVMAGPDEHQLQCSMMKRILQAGLRDRISFPGLVTGETKRSILIRADLFVLPSSGEGMPMAVLEAMASRTPVLISKECNMPEIQPAGAGSIVERSPAAFAEAISRFLDNPEARTAAANNAYQLASDRFSWDPIVSRLEDIYARSIAVKVRQSKQQIYL